MLARIRNLAKNRMKPDEHTQRHHGTPEACEHSREDARRLQRLRSQIKRYEQDLRELAKT
jgi:hypothetical protein